MKSWEIEDFCYKQGLNDGRAAGIKDGIIKTFISLVNDGLLDKETAAKKAGISVPELEAYLNQQALPTSTK